MATIDTDKVGNRIRELRIKRGLSVAQMLAETNIPKPTYYRYETADAKKLPAKIHCENAVYYTRIPTRDNRRRPLARVDYD